VRLVAALLCLLILLIRLGHSGFLLIILHLLPFFLLVLLLLLLVVLILRAFFIKANMVQLKVWRIGLIKIPKLYSLCNDADLCSIFNDIHSKDLTQILPVTMRAHVLHGRRDLLVRAISFSFLSLQEQVFALVDNASMMKGKQPSENRRLRIESGIAELKVNNGSLDDHLEQFSKENDDRSPVLAKCLTKWLYSPAFLTFADV